MNGRSSAVSKDCREQAFPVDRLATGADIASTIEFYKAGWTLLTRARSLAELERAEVALPAQKLIVSLGAQHVVAAHAAQMKKRAGNSARLVAWYRTFEWEIGNDSLGHPHFHFWWLSPYIEVDLIRHLWRCALRTAGYAPSVLEHVIVDIREVKDAEAGAREVIKYVTKDLLPERRLISPALFARVYEAIDGRRLNQASAAFFKGIKGTATCTCGASGCFRRSNTPPDDASGSRANE